MPEIIQKQKQQQSFTPVGDAVMGKGEEKKPPVSVKKQDYAYGSGALERRQSKYGGGY